MKTLKQADNYIKKAIGKGIDFDGQYGYQCADLSVDYMYYITDKKVRMWGNAKDLINNDFKGLATVYKNTPSFLAKKGDVFVMGVNRGGGYGHTGIVVSATLNTITVIEQNWLGGGATFSEVTTKRTHGYDKEMWFIRPKFAKAKKSTAKKTTAKKSTSKSKKTSWTFTVGGEPIETRIGSPKLSARSGGHVQPNQTMTFNKLVKSEGFEWGMLTNNKGQKEYIPFRPLSKSRNAWGVLK